MLTFILTQLTYLIARSRLSGNCSAGASDVSQELDLIANPYTNSRLQPSADYRAPWGHGANNLGSQYLSSNGNFVNRQEAPPHRFLSINEEPIYGDRRYLAKEQSITDSRDTAEPARESHIGHSSHKAVLPPASVTSDGMATPVDQSRYHRSTPHGDDSYSSDDDNDDDGEYEEADDDYDYDQESDYPVRNRGKYARENTSEKSLYISDVKRPYTIPKRSTGSKRKNVNVSPRGSPESLDSSSHTTKRSRRQRNNSPPVFNAGAGVGVGLAPSRYSGAQMPWHVNADPPMTRAQEIKSASLVKRGLKKGQEDKVCVRGYGANDPENIAIVNMKEKEGLHFAEIQRRLNEQRTREGRKNNMSFCSVASRYNRTAPLIFASEGRHFVPLSQRRDRELAKRHGKPIFDDDDDEAEEESQPAEDNVFRSAASPPAAEGSQLRKMKQGEWNEELDLLLVKMYRDYDANRWYSMARTFTELTKLKVTAEQIATRHTLL